MTQSYTTPDGHKITTYDAPSPDDTPVRRCSVVAPDDALMFDGLRDDAKTLGSYLVAACLGQLVPDDEMPASDEPTPNTP